MMLRSLSWFLILLLLSCAPRPKSSREFSLHLFTEPQHFDPALSSGSLANYLFNNTLRGLYRYDDELGILPEGGECQWKKPLLLHCQLFNRFWSNGEPVLASHFLEGFRHLVNPETAAPRANLLINLKNAKKIMLGELPPESLGVRSPNSHELFIEFEKSDSEFLFKLTSSAILPRHPNNKGRRESFKTFVSNGPYQIAEWTFGRDLLLVPNKKYQQGHPYRPNIRFYFIDEDMTAYRLYLNKKLTFLRRLPTKLIRNHQGKRDFFQKPVSRFDYIGFGPDLEPHKNLRQALVQAIDYSAFKRLLWGLGRPGCPSIPKKWMDKQPCFDLDLTNAKKVFSNLPKLLQDKTYDLKVSQLGGIDMKKQAEFLQNQWQKIGFKTRITQVEQKAYLRQLRQKPPAVFRKGIGLEIPTCLNALNNFSPEHRRNYLRIDNKDYQEILKQLSVEQNSQRYKKLCRQAVEVLMNQYRIIPLGEIHFSILADPRFTGWALNSMNQLDLGQLHFVK